MIGNEKEIYPVHFTFKRKKLHIKISKKNFDLFPEKSNYHKVENGKVNIFKNFFGANKEVKDEWRFVLYFDSNESRWELRDVNALDEAEEEFHNIVIILESPHKKEYDENFEPIGPAKGSTGKNFETYFTTHVLPLLFSFGLNLEQNNEYNICFVNPVQYQTSLHQIIGGKLNTSIRNKVWEKLFEVCFDDLKKRLEDYVPEIIIVACTIELKNKLTDVLNSLPGISTDKIFSSTHPSLWGRCFSQFKQYLN